MSRHQNKPVDMSVPPEERGKRRRNRKVITPPAQLAHATSPRARRLTRDGQRWLAAQERLREDAASFTAEVAELDEEGFITRALSRIQDEDDVLPDPLAGR
jgi:hypothetical protein